jgi:hypothetical protein
MAKDAKGAKAKFSVSVEHLTELYKRVETGRALTACAPTEESLVMTLEAKMRRLPRDVRDRIFGGTGPLSNFSSKIDIAFAFGIVDAAMRTELHTIRKIRNKFAHTTEDIYFHTDSVVELCNQLSPSPEEDAEGMEHRYLDATSRVTTHLSNETRRLLTDEHQALLGRSTLASLARIPAPDQTKKGG